MCEHNKTGICRSCFAILMNGNPEVRVKQVRGRKQSWFKKLAFTVPAES